MTTFGKRSIGTTYDERNTHQDRDSHQQRDSYQQRAGLATADNLMSAWTGAFYDYAEQVLKAQRRFAESMWATAAPMLNVAQDLTSPEAQEGGSAHPQRDGRSDQRHEGSHGSRNNELREGEDPAEYHPRSAENKMSDDTTWEARRTERANTQADEVSETRASVAASAADHKRP
jgi:hypothetical protein